MAQARSNYAPGMRVEIRDAEWRVKRVDYSSDGGYVVGCEGLSELVQGREGLFLTKLENIRILDPKDTHLVDDLSSNFGASLLYLDSLLRKTAPSDGRIHLGHRAAIDQLPFQLTPALQALHQPRQRILIADSVGLGKTLEANIRSKGLVGVGVPRKARPNDLKEGTRYAVTTPMKNEHDIALGWDDIKTLTEDTITKTFMDDTLPAGPTERSIVYQAPFFKPDREQDYGIAWAFFEATPQKH